jgi:hypothetical protein
VVAVSAARVALALVAARVVVVVEEAGARVAAAVT